MPTLLLVRHGRSTANTAGVLAGWTPEVGLDDTGRAQVAALAEQLATLPVVRVVSSPLQRCQETATAVAAAHDLPVTTEVGLAECRYGAWTGRSIKELAGDPLWATVQSQPSAVTFPESPDFESESLAAMAARSVNAVRRLDQQVREEHGDHALWVAVSHGDPIKAILADALGSHLDSFQRISTSPASLSVIQYTNTRPYVVRLNDRAGNLADLIPPAPGATTSSNDATPGGATDAAPTDAPASEPDTAD